MTNISEHRNTNQSGPQLEPLGVRIENLQKSFRQKSGVLAVLGGLSADIKPGSFVSVIGPSGAGKSTLLSILAGLEKPGAGSVELYSPGGKVSGPLLGKVGLMPQRDLLLPWRDALGNAIAGLGVRGVPKATAQQQALRMFQEVGLAGFANSYPYQLSGGMRQRVSFVRSALAAGGLMLLDEPFGALDALTRANMQQWLLDAWARLGSTIVFVTHDVDEAILLADRVLTLTPRPAMFAADIIVPLARPRVLDALATPEFTNCKRTVLAALQREQAP